MTSGRGIIVIGAGAIGSFLAGRLHLAGQGVALVARGGRLDSLRREGLRFEADGVPARIDVPLSGSLEGAEPARLVVVCAKMNDFAAALAAAAPAVAPGTAILTVQNGVEAPALAAARFPAATVLASRVHGFFELEDGLVRHVGVPPSLELGAFGSDPGSLAPEVALLLDRAGIPARCSPDIAASLWSKFLLAASLGGVALAFGLPAGMVARDPDARTMLETALAEVRDLAAARGVVLPPDIVRTIIGFVASFPENATTSLQRDVIMGRRSEYDFLPGAVLRLGQESGTGTPCFALMDRMVSDRHPRRGLAAMCRDPASRASLLSSRRS